MCTSQGGRPWEHLQPNSLYRTASLQTSNGFFCSVNHLSGGGVNANHNAKHSSSLACKNKTENDSRLLKNSEGNRHDAWTFCRRQETRIRNIRKMFEENLSQLLPETGRSRATNLKTQKKTKWIKMHQSKVKMCFLRGPLR